MADIAAEPAWTRVLRLGAAPAQTRDADSLANEVAWLELEEGEGEAPDADDARALLRLAQDLLKYKQEQVNTMLGEIDKLRRENGSKRRKKLPPEDSPTRSNDSYLETVAHQEEEIRANKEILEQLYADIAELEGRKTETNGRDRLQLDRDSNSSREPLSERDAVRQLEDQIVSKNKHIRKLLTDIKILEEENRVLKEKVSVVKDKLSEATDFIENLTEQVLKFKNDCSVLKETIGKTEEAKEQLILEIDDLKKKLNEKESNKMEFGEEMQAKLLHWKNHAKARKSENEKLQKEITRLKEENAAAKDDSYLPNIIQHQEEQIKHLQEKLSEASDEILDSVKLIEALKEHNKRLKKHPADTVDSSIASKSESEDKKDGVALSKMKRKIHSLTSSLKMAEETSALREQELVEITSQLQIIESGEEGVQALLDGLKSKKRQLKLNDVAIKSLVQEVNTLSQVVDGLQTENEAMREKLGIGPEKIIPTKGVLSKFYKSEKRAVTAERTIREMENAFVNLELEFRKNEKSIFKLKDCLSEAGITTERIEELLASSDSESEIMPVDGGGDSVVPSRKRSKKPAEVTTPKITEEMQALLEENDGLRKGMEEILEFLKDNSTTTSGTLAVQCPSLEKVVHTLDARHAAGWYAPHMTAVMGLQAAIGGRDALLTALHQARKETFEVMIKLSKESEKSSHLEQRLQGIENETTLERPQQNDDERNTLKNGVFGNWMSHKDFININLMDKKEVHDLVQSGNQIHEEHLKEALAYFQKQFKGLYQKMTEISIQTTNDQNKWAIEEEKYKAEILSLRAQLDVYKVEDSSENSEGIVAFPNAAVIARKCTYLEESYRYIRTLNENIKNEYLDRERENIIMAVDFESQVQGLILTIANMTDRLRNSTSLDLFLKQNEMLNDINIKYRELLNEKLISINENRTLVKELEKQTSEIIKELTNSRFIDKMERDEPSLHSTEVSILRQQLANVCKQYEEVKKITKHLEDRNFELQLSQKQLVDNTLMLATKQDYEMIQNQVEKFVEENRSLKDQCLHVSKQLEISLSQLQDTQQRQMLNDLEINMLRHQILDLQATGDNKAIIARLSGEILIAHLQTSDTCKKIDRLNSALAKEKQRRMEAEEMLKAREKIFNVYAARFEFRFRYMFEVLQTLRQQYQGAVPTASIENYLNNIEDLSRNTAGVSAKLSELEDLRSLLSAKIQVFNEMLESGKFECPIDERKCPHEIKLAINQSVHTREIELCKKKIEVLEQSRVGIAKRCSSLERTLVLVNQGFDKSPLDNIADSKMLDKGNVTVLEVEDITSEDDEESRRSQTITLPKPQILKARKPSLDSSEDTKPHAADETIHHLPGSPIKPIPEKRQNKKTTTVVVQTEPNVIATEEKITQTDMNVIDVSKTKLKNEIRSLKEEKDNKQKELNAALLLASKRADDNLSLETSKLTVDSHLKTVNETVQKQEAFIEELKRKYEDLKKEINTMKNEEHLKNKQKKESTNEEIKSLLQSVKTLQDDKNLVIEEYKEMLKNERDEYSNSIKEYQVKINELQDNLDKQDLGSVSDNNDTNPIVVKYTEKMCNLENQCFKLQNAFDGCKTDLKSCQNELERWKTLANERLTKIEHMSAKFEERYSHEMDSYRTESQHWLSQLAENQKDGLELRSKLAEQRTLFLKQLTEKDSQIELQKSAAQNLKSQILSLQSMMSASDPSFDLSAIVEVSEASDASPQGSERLEIRFHSSHDLTDQAAGDDYIGKEPAVTSPTWQETLVDRLRREKQVVGKQNALLRRQIKALAGRERRSRLEALNLKTQMYRLTSSGGKLSSAETATISLHSKVAALQSQLSSARRDNHSTAVTAWDKWKRAQQLADRWQGKYEDKCQELKKCEVTLNYTKSAVSRLEKEKRLLLARVGEMRNDKHISFLKEAEQRPSPLSKDLDSNRSDRSNRLPPHITVQSLMDRVEAQQRRIAALELADKGHEPLVTEYEKVLSQNTLLKGQMLKLESQLLESQLTSGGTTLMKDSARQSELEHLRSYCETLKEENLQLSAKVCSLSTVEGGSHSSAAHRIHDLEQTVLTLRGLVSKLQAEQKKTSSSPKRTELLRPGSGHSASEQERNQLESSRLEVSNLRRSIQEKDLLLERSRDLLKMAADREDELLQEITFLRHQEGRG